MSTPPTPMAAPLLMALETCALKASSNTSRKREPRQVRVQLLLGEALRGRSLLLRPWSFESCSRFLKRFLQLHKRPLKTGFQIAPRFLARFLQLGQPFFSDFQLRPQYFNFFADCRP